MLIYFKKKPLEEGKNYLNTNIGVCVKIDNLSIDLCPYYQQ